MAERENIANSDEDVLLRYRASGSQDLLGNLYNKYMHLVYGLCLKCLKDREKSQDAVMSIYEKISTALLDTEVTHFKSWLYMVSKNHCLMELRKANREKAGDVFMESAEVVHLNDTDDWLEGQLDQLEQCMEQLKADQKKCVQLFFLENKSYKEVNEISGIELKKVKSYIQNGKRNLKICMEESNVKA